jgi:hypothetical protein
LKMLVTTTPRTVSTWRGSPRLTDKTRIIASSGPCLTE